MQDHPAQTTGQEMSDSHTSQSTSASGQIKIQLKVAEGDLVKSMAASGHAFEQAMLNYFVAEIAKQKDPDVAQTHAIEAARQTAKFFNNFADGVDVVANTAGNIGDNLGEEIAEKLAGPGQTPGNLANIAGEWAEMAVEGYGKLAEALLPAAVAPQGFAGGMIDSLLKAGDLWNQNQTGEIPREVLKPLDEGIMDLTGPAKHGLFGMLGEVVEGLRDVGGDLTRERPEATPAAQPDAPQREVSTRESEGPAGNDNGAGPDHGGGGSGSEGASDAADAANEDEGEDGKFVERDGDGGTPGERVEPHHNPYENGRTVTPGQPPGSADQDEEKTDEQKAADDARRREEEERKKKEEEEKKEAEKKKEEEEKKEAEKKEEEQESSSMPNPNDDALRPGNMSEDQALEMKEALRDEWVLKTGDEMSRPTQAQAQQFAAGAEKLLHDMVTNYAPDAEAPPPQMSMAEFFAGRKERQKEFWSGDSKGGIGPGVPAGELMPMGSDMSGGEIPRDYII